MMIDLSTLTWIPAPDDLLEAWVDTEKFENDHRMVAWITKRPAYCDRGHWQVNIALPLDLDEQDGFPRYYMTLETAKKETELFLDWRINKVRGE